MTTFEIYKGVLKFYSGYFQLALKNIEEGRFVESVENMITLPDEELEVFKAFKTWLYTRKLPEPNRGSSGIYLMLVKLWCFGDRRQIPLLQNECVRIITVGMKTFNIVPTASLEFIYEHTLVQSPIRRLIVYAATKISVPGSFEGENGDDWFKESLLDLVKMKILQTRPPTWEEIEAKECEWHIHEEGVTCKK